MFDIPLAHLLAGIGALLVFAVLLCAVGVACCWIGELMLEWRASAHMAVADRTWKMVDSLRAEVAKLTEQRDGFLAQAERAEEVREAFRTRNHAIIQAIRAAHESATGEVDESSAEDLARHLGEFCREWLGRARKAEERAAECLAQSEKAEREVAERVARLQSCVGFLSSVIKSGEPWSETCQKATDEAMERTALDPVARVIIADGSVAPTRCPNCGVGHGALHLDGCAAKGGGVLPGENP